MKPGDYVEWICKPCLGPSFWANGRIIKIYETTVGAYKTKQVAKIYIHSQCKYPNDRKNTTISLDKLRLITTN